MGWDKAETIKKIKIKIGCKGKTYQKSDSQEFSERNWKEVATPVSMAEVGRESDSCHLSCWRRAREKWCRHNEWVVSGQK